MAELRIIFMGTAELACASLKALAAQPDFQVISVVTQPDRPKGRDMKLGFSPVKEVAVAAGLTVLQPERARYDSFVQQLRELKPDLMVVAAYGQILPQSILDLPRWGCLNVHTSLLPKYRGAAPIQWAILAGERETGVTIMQMDAGLDTGPMLAQTSTPISSDDTSQTVHDRLAELGATLLIPTIRGVLAGTILPQPQPAQAVSYAHKIKKEDGKLDWAQPAETLRNRIRAFTPWPGGFTQLAVDSKPVLIKVWKTEVASRVGVSAPGTILAADKNGIVVACGENALKITELQREGGRRVTAQQFLAGNPLTPGEQFI